MTTTDSKSTVRLPAPRLLTDDMTQAELALYEQGSSAWGTAEERAVRGADFLDRVMPGWADKVEINTLRMSQVCDCVLGQLFTSTSQTLRGYRTDPEDLVVVDANDQQVSDWTKWDLSSGFDLGCDVLGINSMRRDKDYPAVFFGFDRCDTENDYLALQQAWEQLIAERRHAT